ncbi:MAG: hypothetical protein PVI49_03655 [Desulfobacterales bacterium]|jgi:hypothetical protein
MEDNIRDAHSDDVTELSNIIRDAYRDVANRFGLTPTNCSKHPSNCTDEWIENDLARGVRYYVIEYEGRPVGCVAIELAGRRNSI